MRRMLDVDIPGKRRRDRPNIRWKDACKRDMTQAGLKEDNATNRAEWKTSNCTFLFLIIILMRNIIVQLPFSYVHRSCFICFQ